MEEELGTTLLFHTTIVLGMALACFYTWCVYKVGFRRGHCAGYRYGFSISEMRRDGLSWSRGYTRGLAYSGRTEDSSLQ